MKKHLLALTALAVLGFAAVALAGTGQHEIVNPEVAGATATASFPTTCYLEADDVTSQRSIYVSCTEYLSVSGDTITGAIVLDDGSGASPSFTFTDGTDETMAFSKVDAGYLTATSTAGDGLNVLVGNFKVGNGTPGLTLGGEDAYVEGTFEVDGVTQLDGAVTLASATVTGASVLSGDVTGDGGDQLVGFLQNQVATTTTTLTAAQCGTTFIAAAAAVPVLPEASTVLGCRYTFVSNTADDVDIDPADASDQIGPIAVDGAAIAPSAGDEVRMTDIGTTLTLEAVGANLWVAISHEGPITDVN